jgi:ABC-type proline/glycine betaine transport system permease subunit
MVGILNIRRLIAAKGLGAVFTTGHGGHQTTWIMVDHDAASVRYAACLRTA